MTPKEFASMFEQIAIVEPEGVPWRCRWFGHGWEADKPKTWPQYPIRTSEDVVRYERCRRCAARRIRMSKLVFPKECQYDLSWLSYPAEQAK